MTGTAAKKNKSHDKESIQRFGKVVFLPSCRVWRPLRNQKFDSLHSLFLLKLNRMLVSSIPCACLVVVVEKESMLCLMLNNFIEDIEIDELVSDLASAIHYYGTQSLPTHHPANYHLYIIFLLTSSTAFGSRNREIRTFTVSTVRVSVSFSMGFEGGKR